MGFDCDGKFVFNGFQTTFKQFSESGVSKIVIYSLITSYVSNIKTEAIHQCSVSDAVSSYYVFRSRCLRYIENHWKRCRL